MSPLLLRRYRAERLLRDEFEALSGRVLRGVERRLRAAGAELDRADLEACYSQAWQGLYAEVLAGEEIANPAGWLALATYRRALEEHRLAEHSRRHPGGLGGDHEEGAGRWQDGGRELAEQLDDRVRLRQLFEGLRGRLTARELEAATLCYLHGLTRAEAAVRMGVSEARMRKLMEGTGARSPGIAGKVGALVASISSGDWCDEQASLMRGLAYGMLDPDGDRYRLAQLHTSECPACRAYVLSLRGLAAVLPPVPALLHLVLGGAGAAASRAAQAPLPGPHAPGSGTAAGSVAPGGSAIAPTLSASGVAGGAAGGGWALAGGAGAKLAIGCLLALSLSAGCVALSAGPAHTRPARRDRRAAIARAARVDAPVERAGEGAGESAGGGGDARSTAAPTLTPAAGAEREFGPEQALAGAEQSSEAQTSDRATAASSNFEAGAGTAAAGSRSGTPKAAEQRPSTSSSRAVTSSSSAGAPSSSASSAAEREFGIG